MVGSWKNHEILKFWNFWKSHGTLTLTKNTPKTVFQNPNGTYVDTIRHNKHVFSQLDIKLILNSLYNYLRKKMNHVTSNPPC